MGGSPMHMRSSTSCADLTKTSSMVAISSKENNPLTLELDWVLAEKYGSLKDAIDRSVEKDKDKKKVKLAN
jgi:hypothetical protein